MAKAIMLITILGLIMFGCYYAGYITNMGWFNLLINPSSILTEPWYVTLTSSLSLLLAVGIVVGSIVFKSDIGINAGIALAILTPLVQATLDLHGTISTYNVFIAHFIAGTLLLLIVFTIFEWFRGKD
jgi:uncharacterized membrane protein (UPF0182 family)